MKPRKVLMAANRSAGKGAILGAPSGPVQRGFVGRAGHLTAVSVSFQSCLEIGSTAPAQNLFQRKLISQS